MPAVIASSGSRAPRVFTPLVEVPTLASFNSRTTVFQTVDAGAIPAARTISEPILRTRIAGCNPAREGSIPSRLSKKPQMLQGLHLGPGSSRDARCVSSRPLVAA